MSQAIKYTLHQDIRQPASSGEEKTHRVHHNIKAVQGSLTAIQKNGMSFLAGDIIMASWSRCSLNFNRQRWEEAVKEPEDDLNKGSEQGKPRPDLRGGVPTSFSRNGKAGSGGPCVPPRSHSSPRNPAAHSHLYAVQAQKSPV